MNLHDTVFDPIHSTEKADGMFATVIIVLPSKFTGGEAHLSHGGLSTDYDSSNDSHLQTTVMAWYTDVAQEIKPIKSGYRLALAYNLVNTHGALRPALSANTEYSAGLRHSLSSWEEGKGSTPEKIFYLLERSYSQANLCGGALTGTDSQKVALLEMVAKELGFHLGLASIECHHKGSSNEYSEGRYGHSGHITKEVDFCEITKRTLSIRGFVDLNGRPIADSIGCSEGTEMIPKDLHSIVEARPHDEQKYEGYMGVSTFAAVQSMNTDSLVLCF